MILISIAIIIFNFGFTKEYKLQQDDQDFAKEHGGDEAREQCSFEEKAPPRPINLLLPLCLLILSTLLFLWLTGKDQGIGLLGALIHADFEKAIFISALTTLVLTSLFYLFQKIPLREIESHFLSGGYEMMPPIVVLILSWGLAGIIGAMGFGEFITTILAHNVPVFLIPALVFVIGCFVSYFMGTAWGTWALLMPLAVTLAVSAGINLPLVIGAVLAGGSLGDNASPLGETAILTATITEIPVMEHVKSQLPYSLAGVGISAILFTVFSYFI